METQATPDLLADGLGFPEGPVVLHDGRICFVELYRGRVAVLGPGGGVATYARTGGAPNGCAVAMDGSLYVCQNGGTVGAWTAEEVTAPSIQRIAREGGPPEEICTRVDGLDLNGPNDLVFGPNGRLYFTDPGPFRPDRMTPSRIFLLEADGSGRLLLEIDPPGYPNGIGLLDDGTLIWSETMTGLLRKLRIDTGDVMAFGRLSGDAPSADGLVVTDDGIVYVATPRAAGLDVFSRAGAHLGLMPVGTMPTNCALEGDSLIVTDAGVLHEDGQPALGGSIWRVPMGHWRA